MSLAPSLRALLDRPAAARRLGPFVLVHQLGHGGFAPVWLAREVYDEVEIRRAAVKLFAFAPGVPGASEEARPQIMEEARLLCRVEHPNIPRFYSLLSDETSGVVGLVMEHVEGASLEKRLRVRRRLSVHETLAIGIAIASALAAIHRAGLVHRDVKPSNILDAGGTYKLIDFGIASARQGAPAAFGEVRRVLSADLPETALTADMTTFSGLVRMADGTAPLGDGGLLPPGTPGYIDPQCVATAAPATPSSDLYALGATLFECLTGKLPSVIAAGARGGMDAAVIDGRTDAPPVGEHAPDLPPALATLVDSLLSPRRQKRPASAESVVLRLERIRAEKLGRKIHLPAEEVGPFRGLGRFEGSDRDVYFGRSAEVAATMDLLRRRGLVTLVGASGAGKSSLARAGVAPQVADDGLGGWIKKWDVVITAPGPRPWEAITSALTPLVPDAAALDPDQLADRMARGAESRGKGVLLVVDQLEELVTVAEAGEASWLAALLARIADPPHPFVRALAAARRDLLDPLLSLGRLGATLPRSMLVVSPMSGADWANAIDQALSAYGYSFEDGDLRDELLAEIESRATAMPLVQFALTELWKHRDAKRKIITRAGLAEIGGLSGALERHAEATLRQVLNETSLPLSAVREVLLAMTTPQGTRAALTPEDLESALGQGVRALVARLESARLLVREEDGITLAHDTLLAQWWRLRDWIATAREDRILAEDIERDAARWAREKEDPSLLWKKRRLAAAEDLLRVGLVKLSPLAERFVNAGRPMERRARLALAAVALLGLAAATLGGGRCTGKSHEDQALATEQSREIERLGGLVREQEQERCDEAAKLRERAEGALSQGRALRTLSILRKARARCPGSASESAHVELAALAELRRSGDHEELARSVIEDPAATPRAREAAARRVEPPDTDADSLVREGQAAFARGEAARARLLFDRAIHLLESRGSDRLTVSSPWQIEGDISAAAWSAQVDNRLTVIHGGVASVLDGATGKEVSRVELDSDVHALSPDGTRIALETKDHGVRILDTSRGIQVGALPAQPGPILALALSAEPGRVITVRSGPTVELWSVAGNASLGRLPALQGEVRAAAISNDGKVVALGMSDGTVIVHAAGKRSSTFAAGEARGEAGVNAVALSPDGRLVAWGADDGAGRLARVEGDARSLPLGEASTAVQAITFSGDGDEVYTARSGSIVQWSTAGALPVLRRTLPVAGRIRVLSCSPDGRIAVGSEQQAGLAILGAAGKRDLGKDLAAVRELAFSPGGDALLAAMDDRTLSRLGVTRGGFLQTAPDTAVTLATSLSPDGERALALSGEGKLHVWSTRTGAAIEVPQGPNDPLLAAAFEPGGDEIVSIAGDGGRRIWDAATGRLVRALPGQSDRFKFAVLSPDRRSFVIWRHRQLELRDTRSGEIVHRFAGHGDEMIRAAVFSADGKRLFTGGDDRKIRTWSTGSGALVETLIGADRPVHALAASPAGHLIAAAAPGGAILLFREGTSGPVGTILLLARGPDGEGAIIATPDGHVDLVGSSRCLAREKLTCRVGPVHLPFEVCEDRFYTPGLLASLVAENRSYSDPESGGHSLDCAAPFAPERTGAAPR